MRSSSSVCLAMKRVELAAALLDLPRLAGELMLALVERVVAAIERLLALHHAVLEGTELAFALLLLPPRPPACSG